MDLKLKNNSQLSIPIYNQVEYVESSGVVNIDTGVGIVMNRSYHSIKATIEVVENNGTNSMIFSAHIYGNPTDTARCAFNLFCNGTSTDSFKVQAIYPYNTNLPEVSFSGKTTIEQGKGYITINGVSSTVSTSNSNHTFNLILLEGDVKVRIWNFQVLYNGEPIRNYIPVKSLESGHIGEACLYDTVNNVYKYSSSTGSFTASPSQGLYDVITSAYVKDCPNIDGIDLLRRAINLNRIRCNINSSTGHTAEIYKYAQLSGFNDAGEQQTKPRIVGTFNIDDYYTNAEIAEIRSKIDGITITTPTASDYNIDTLLDNDGFAVQTIDENNSEYNQPVAEVLTSANLTHSLASDDTKVFMTKTEAAAITSLPVDLFRGNTDIESFDEFKYWTGLTSITGGSSTSILGAFGGCTSLESITIPEGITSIGAYGFYNCTSLENITIPSTLTSTGNYSFSSCSGSNVYYNGTLEQWMKITFDNSGQTEKTNPTAPGCHLFIQGNELTNLVIPSGITAIKPKTFYGCKFITGTVIIPDEVTSIGNASFYGCSSLEHLIIPSQTTSLGQYNFIGTPNLNVVIKTTNNFKLDTFSWSVGKTLRLYGGITTSTITHYQIHFTDSIIIDGNYQPGLTSRYAFQTYCPKVFRVQGNLSNSYTLTNASAANAFKFIEVIGTASFSPSIAPRGLIVHLGYNNVTWSPSWASNVTNWNLVIGAVYVGSGISRAADQAILDLYNASSTWTSYIAKFGLWYDYNGKYKWYYITDSLTNCTNTNPDEWPHITRGEEYKTTIVANEGYTLGTVKVEMYSARDNSLTPDEPTDITSAVYNASTGEIYIQEVVGNVIITASAS